MEARASDRTQRADNAAILLISHQASGANLRTRFVGLPSGNFKMAAAARCLRSISRSTNAAKVSNVQNLFDP